MASIPLLKGCLPTSTPIHQNKEDNYSEGFQRIFISSSDELSPIKDIVPSKQIFSSYLSDLDNQNLTVIENAFQQSSNPSVIRAAKKLRFADCSDTVNKNKAEHYRNFENDSGFNSVDILSPEVKYSPDSKCFKFTDLNCSFSCGKEYHCIQSLYKNELTKNNKHSQPNSVRLYNSFKFLKTRNGLVSDIMPNPDIVPLESSVSEKVDLISSLYSMNCTSILSQMLSYLSNEDLRNASNVNKKWRIVITQDMRANARRNQYLRERKERVRGPNKENSLSSKVIKVKDHKHAFSDVKNVLRNHEQPLTKIFRTPKCTSLPEELKNLKNHGLILKCPKCRSPSEIESGNKYCCTRRLCQHVFCKKCWGPYLEYHACSVKSLDDDDIPKIIIIGSKKSKKNLKRL